MMSISFSIMRKMQIAYQPGGLLSDAKFTCM